MRQAPGGDGELRQANANAINNALRVTSQVGRSQMSAVWSLFYTLLDLTHLGPEL